MTDALEKLYSLLSTTLFANCPVLSGSMKSHISFKGQVAGRNEFVIEISAPYYDIQKWIKEKKISYTGEVRNGKTDYALDVNLSGGFGRHNKSERWVDRSCIEAAQVIANEIGAILINEL